ncbi:MAG: diguanylate cyclase [Candidatus Omnitrophota bacterium]|nr:diguanylate cyclase [Candidatus Omnitrophota bacterium]
MKKSDKSAISPKGLKYKLKISFALMSILPLLVCVYLVSHYMFPRVGLRVDIIVFIVISIFIALIGFFVVKEVFDRIVSITNGAKLIASGDYYHNLEVLQGDEVGDLGDAFNKLTQRIRNNMDELKNYSEKTAEINLGIQKRIIVLSGLLQISSLISQSAKLEEILKAIVEKSRLLASSDTSFLLYREEGQETFYMRWAEGLGFQQLLDIRIDPTDDVFYRINNSNKPFILDKKNLLPAAVTSFVHDKLRLRNTLILPISLRGRIIALLGIGNNIDYVTYVQEDIELLDVFAKQLAIAVENDILNHSIRKLEIKDNLTGLYNEVFMRSRLQEEIKRAIMYQRPCAFILLDIDNFKPYTQKFGSIQTESALKKIAVLIRGSVSEIDRVGRMSDDEFAVILPEKNKRQAQEMAEGIRKKIEFSFSEEEDTAKRVTVSGGVSENPLDGINAEELIAKAKEMMDLAKKAGRNRIAIVKETQ